MTGSWFDPSNPGQGFNIEVLDNKKFVVYWYAYDQAEPLWLTGVGTFSDDTVTIQNLETFRGSNFGINHNKDLVERSDFGTLSIKFTSCDSGSVSYNSIAGFGSGTIQITRLTSISNLQCNPPNFDVLHDSNFSKAFIIPEKSGVNNVTIGGISAKGDSYSVDFNFGENLTLSITNANLEDSISEILEQKLRNTTWQGTYAVNNDNFTTNLNLVVVQNGYVGGEIIHSEPVEEGNGFLHARVTGDIVTQFEINGSFVDEDRIGIDTLDFLPENTQTRQLIRVKRMRALEFRNDNDGSNWNTNREYRLILENGTLSGIVGIPNTTIGSSDNTSGNGIITLTQQ